MRISSISGLKLQIQQCCLTNLSCWDFPHGRAPFWRYYCFHEGSAEIRWIDGQNREHLIETKPDTSYVIPPDTCFSGRLSSSSATHLFIHFSLGTILDSLNRHIYEINKSEEVSSLIHKMADKEKSLYHREGSAFEIFTIVSSSLSSIPGDDWPTSAYDSRIRHSINIINDCFRENLTVADLAEKSCMSDNGFARLFKSETGKPPMHYLNTVRLNAAADLLSHSDHTIEEIAEETGFSNRFYFSRKFSRHFSLSPAKYRKMNRG